MDTYKVDYHLHTNYSDGRLSPQEMVQKYHDLGYDVIAITDHDGIDGYKEAKIAGDSLKIKVIPGVEISTKHNKIRMHLLGYNFDVENKKLIAELKRFRGYREERNKKLFKALKEMGYKIGPKDVEGLSKGGYIGKPQIAEKLLEKGYIKSFNEAFDDIFERPEIKKLKRKSMDTIDAIELINQAGGMAVLAHPGKIKKIGERNSEEYWENFEKLLVELKKAGLKGLECYYKDHSEEEVYKFTELAAKYHLHMTTGSDDHGRD